MLVQTELQTREFEQLLTGNVGPSAAISQNMDESSKIVIDVKPDVSSEDVSVSENCTLIRKAIHPTDKLMKRQLILRGTQLVIPLATVECIWKLISLGIASVINTSLSIDTVIQTLSESYSKLSDGDSKRAQLTWQAERKSKGIKRGETVNGMALSNVVKSSNYSASNIDLFFLAKAFKVTFVIISSKITSQTGTEIITYSGMEEANIMSRVIVCKRGQKGLLAFYNLIVSDKEYTLNNILPAFAKVIKANLIDIPYHLPLVKVVTKKQ